MLYICLSVVLFVGQVVGESLDKLFKGSEVFERAHVGICILDVETEEMVYAFEEEKFFVPASLQKIPLSVAAVLSLGDEFCFQTTLAYEGVVKEGVLHGNLWVKGGGDPTLSLEIFSEWKEALKERGIDAIDGKIIIDPTVFESAMASPFWYFEDLGNYFGAGASGLSINKNLYKITFKRGEKEGDPASVIQIDPEIPYLVFENEVTTGPAGSGDRVYVFGSEYFPKQFYKGTVPLDKDAISIRSLHVRDIRIIFYYC